jgi:SAM-dependent methyltransferase
MHQEAMQYVSSQVRRRHLNLPGVRVLDLGGRNVNGTPRRLFHRAAAYVAVDIKDGPGVDIVADAADLNLRERFHVVVSTELLEHTPRGAAIVAAAARHLVPGGTFLATMAGPGRAPHGASGEIKPPRGEFYRNVEPEALHGWLRDAGFVAWDVNQFGTDLRCRAEVAA